MLRMANTAVEMRSVYDNVGVRKPLPILVCRHPTMWDIR